MFTDELVEVFINLYFHSADGANKLQQMLLNYHAARNKTCR